VAARVSSRGSAACRLRGADPPALTRMRPIELADILGRERYGAERDAIRRRIIAHKQARRVAVATGSPSCSRTGPRSGIRRRRCSGSSGSPTWTPSRGARGLQRAPPGPGELSATLLIEIEEQRRLREELNRLVGIDEHVTLEVGGELRVAATFEAGRQTAEKISAVQYVRFPLEAEGRGRIAAGARSRSRWRIRATGRARCCPRPCARAWPPTWPTRRPRTARCGGARWRLSGRARAAARASSRSCSRPCAAPGRAPERRPCVRARAQGHAAHQPGHGVPQPPAPRRGGPDRRHLPRGRVARYEPHALDARPLRVRGLRPDRDLAPSRPLAGLRAVRRAGHLVTSHAYVLSGRCRACRTRAAS